MKPIPEEAAADAAERDPNEPDVLRVLVANHAKFLGFLERRVGSRDVAEDILQEAFVRSLDRVESIRNTDSALAWFYRVLRNALTDHFRRQETRDRALTQVLVEAGEEAAAPDDELEAVVCGCVMATVDTLKPEYAAAVRRVDLDGMSVREYAEESRITPGNCRRTAASGARGATPAACPGLRNLCRARVLRLSVQGVGARSVPLDVPIDGEAGSVAATARL